jgi:hypothetical protein
MSRTTRSTWTFLLTLPTVLVAIVLSIALGRNGEVATAPPEPDVNADEESRSVPQGAEESAVPSPTATELLPNTVEAEKDPALGPIHRIEEFSVSYRSIEELTQGVDQVFVGTVADVNPGRSNAWNVYEITTVTIEMAAKGIAPGAVAYEDIAREATTNRPVIALNQLDLVPGDRVLMFMNEGAAPGSPAELDEPAYWFPNRQTIYHLDGIDITDTGRTDPVIESVESLTLPQLLERVRAVAS